MTKVYRYLLYKFQRSIKNQHVRLRIADLLAGMKPALDVELNQSELQLLSVLDSKGLVFLTNLVTEKQVDDINRYLKGVRLKKRYEREDIESFLIDDVPEGTHTAAVCESDMIGCPHVLSIANNRRILKVVSAFLKCKPTISNIMIWHSFAADGKPLDSENYHRDYDDYRFLKLFIYLSDVHTNNGPHVYIEGSHREDCFLPIKRFDQSEIEQYFDSDRQKIILGKKGSAFLENTYGLHRGVPLKEGIRTVLQIEYGLSPIGAYSYKYKYSNDGGKYDPYINRKYL